MTHEEAIEVILGGKDLTACLDCRDVLDPANRGFHWVKRPDFGGQYAKLCPRCIGTGLIYTETYLIAAVQLRERLPQRELFHRLGSYSPVLPERRKGLQSTQVR